MYFYKPQIKPRKWGNFQDVQYAIRKNAEKIYQVDSDSIILCMPLFWGLPPLDYSGKNNNGTNDGTIYKNNSLEFDGLTNEIHGSLSGLTNFVNTVSGWFYPHTEEDSGNGRRFIILQPASGWNVIFFDSVLTNTPKVGINDGVNGITRIGNNDAITLNAWNHIVYSYDGSASGTGIKIYINGAEISYSSATGANSVSAISTDFIIGANNIDGQYAFDGFINEVCVFKGVRTANQIALFYDRPWALYRPVSRPVYSIPAAPSLYIPQIIIF